MNDREHRNALQAGYKLHWYEIKSILGQGGFGITYLAYDLNLEREVAIKEYLPTEFSVREGDFSVHPSSGNTTTQFEWGLDRFIQEARTLSRFEHPNIVRVHAVFEENNTGYMVMPYEKGHSLQTILSSKKTLNEATLLHLLAPLLEGLAMIHQSGFIHRDIKPDNIFIREDGSPVLLDFGSARQAVAGKTKTLTTLVSPGYAPFEQYYSKSDEQGPWTDIYGLGATLYRAIAGRAPMDAVDRSKFMLDGSKDNFVSASEIGKGRYTDEFLQAIDHALRFKQTERPQTVHAWQTEMKFSEDNVATELATNFDNFTAPNQAAEAEVQNKRSFSAKSLLVAGSALLLAAGGAFFYFKNQQSALIERQGQTVAVQSSESNKQQRSTPLDQPPLVERPAATDIETDRLATAQSSMAVAAVAAEAAEAKRLVTEQQQRALEDERRSQAQRELEIEREKLAGQRRQLDEELAVKKEQERLAELERQKQQEAAQRKVEQQRIAEENKRLAAEKKRLVEEKAAVEAARLQALEAEKQRKLEEQQRLEEEQRQQAEQQRLSLAEQERRIAASRAEFTRRAAETRDKMGYLDRQKPRDLSSVAGRQVSSTVSSAIENWQGVGVAIKRGKTYQISASGEWSPGPLCNTTDPTGENMYTITCWDLGSQIVAKRPHAALIGKIGQQNLAFYIGNEFSFTADTDGTLYMMANDAPGFFFDNKGALQVTISLLD